MTINEYIDDNFDSGIAITNPNDKTPIGLVTVNPYTFVDDAYTGEGGFQDGSHLMPHPRERSFRERKGYSFYVNYFKPILNSLVNPIFKTPCLRDYSENEMYGLFVDNCDNAGTKLNEWIKTFSKMVKRHGAGFVVMDNISDVPNNLGETLATRAIPYIYYKKASEAVYYKTDKYGVLVEIAFFEYIEEKKVFRLWTRGKWELYEEFKDGELKKLIRAGIVQGNIFPVIPFCISDSGEILPNPPLYDIARINTAIYNTWSELREIQRKQGFSILTIPGRPPTSDSMEAGTGSALYYDNSTTNKPEYIQPEVGIQQGYLETIKKLTEDIYRQANLAGVTGVTDSSGIARQWDFQATDSELQEFARNIEYFEVKLAEMFKQWTNQSFDFSISYPEDFGVVDVETEMKQAKSLFELGMPEEVKKEVKKNLIRSFFSYKNDVDIDKLTESIDKYIEPIEQNKDKIYTDKDFEQQ